jgi:hypothetical protein
MTRIGRLPGTEGIFTASLWYVECREPNWIKAQLLIENLLDYPIVWGLQ